MRITFIGGGSMADALIGGLLRRDFPLQDIRVVEISADARRKLVDKYGVTCFDKPKDALRAGDVVVFAVKPQHLREAASKSGIADNANLVISIAAGVRLANLSKWMKGHTRLVRAMPNTPAMIGEGVAGLYPFSKAVTRADREDVETILGAVGDTVWITDESQMDAVTAISGSGPAYVFYFIEAVEEAAAELGLSDADRAPSGPRYLHGRGQARGNQSRSGRGAARARHLQGRHHRASACKHGQGRGEGGHHPRHPRRQPARQGTGRGAGKGVSEGC